MPNSVRRLIIMITLAAAAAAQGRVAVRAVVLQDQTGSVNWTRTPTLCYEDLKPLVNLVRERSGEVAFGLIRDSSNRGLIRLAVTTPEPVGLQTPAKWSANPFIANRERAAFQQKQQAREKERQVWAAANNPLMNSFQAGVESLLKAPDYAKRTDVYGALRRADSFLAEDARAWGGAVYSTAIVISDGRDNQRGATPEWRSKVQVLAVN